jgi:hypothetical protein
MTSDELAGRAEFHYGLLRRLPLLATDGERVAQVRARCHAAMTRRQLQVARSARRARAVRRVVEPALVGLLSLLYLASALVEVAGLHDFL